MNRDYRIVPVKGRLAVLASGGLDSSVMLADLARGGRAVFPLYVRAGLMWERHELATLRSFIRRLGMSNVHPVSVLQLPMGDVAGRHWSMTGRKVPGYRAALASNYILGRNLSLLAKAAVFCAYNRIGEIAMAPLESNPFPDARPEFFRALERAVDLGVGLKLKVLTSYVGMMARICRCASPYRARAPPASRIAASVPSAPNGSRAFAKPEFPTPPNTHADRRGAADPTKLQEPARVRSSPCMAAPGRRSG